MASSASALIKPRKEEGPGVAKAAVADQICVAVQSTSNLLQLMLQSSPSQARLMKLPKNLLAKASAAKNTGRVLEELPHVISSLDEHMESALQSATHLKTVSQLLSNMENSQLKTAVSVGQSLKQDNSIGRPEGSDTNCEVQK